MKKITIILSAIVFVIGAIYLVLPSPIYPDLDNAVRSNEPGDTWQHPDQKAFFTNVVRNDVLNELQKKFSLKLGSITLPSYRLLYRQEETADIVRDQLFSSYFEEVVHPLRESLFINGFEPTNLPAFKNIPAKDVPRPFINGEYYFSKVTLKPVSSPVWARLLVWILIFPATYLTIFSLKRSLRND